MDNENQGYQEGLENLRNSADEAAAAQRAEAAAAAQAAARTKQLSNAMQDGVSSLHNFYRGLDQAGSSVSQLGSVISAGGKAIGDFASIIPGAGVAIKALTAVSTALLGELNSTADAWHEVSKVGASAADGMTGFRQSLANSTLSTKEFLRQINENSTALAKFRGGTADGVKDFADTVGQLSLDTEQTLRKIGMREDDMATATAGYISMQTKMGRSQKMSVDELAQGSKNYALELDLLSKVTGQSREALQKHQQQLMEEDRYRANLADLGQKQQESFRKVESWMNETFGEEAAKGLRDSLSNIGTEASQRLAQSTGGASKAIADQLKAGTITEQEARDQMVKALQDNIEVQRNQQKWSEQGNRAGLSFSKTLDGINSYYSDSFDRAQKTQDDQNASLDDLTQSTVNSEQALALANKNFRELNTKILPSFATMVEATTEALGKLVEFINDILPGTFAQKISSSVKEGYQTVKGKAGELYEGAKETLGIPSSKPAAGQTAEMMKNVYGAFEKAGFSPAQAKALTAEVGRENAYNPATVFGTHRDAANGALNMGMFSWQGDRAEKLRKQLSEKGLLDSSGNMLKNQESLNAMAQFAKQEMESGNYKGLGDFMSDKNVDPDKAAAQLGKGYIKWAYGQDTLRNGTSFDWRAHNRRRANYYSQIDAMVGKGNQTAPASPAAFPGVQTDPLTEATRVYNDALRNQSQVTGPTSTTTTKPPTIPLGPKGRVITEPTVQPPIKESKVEQPVSTVQPPLKEMNAVEGIRAAVENMAKPAAPTSLDSQIASVESANKNLTSPKMDYRSPVTATPPMQSTPTVTTDPFGGTTPDSMELLVDAISQLNSNTETLVGLSRKQVQNTEKIAKAQS